MSYKNLEVDALLDKARTETDYMKRVALYREIEKRAMREAPLIGLHTNSYNILLQPWVKGVDTGYLGPAYIPLRKAQIKKRAE